MKRKGCCGQSKNYEEQRDFQTNNASPRSEHKRRCRMQYCKVPRIIIGIVAIAALLSSIFSCIDCKFVHVDIGFTPDNAIYRSKEFGLGLWSLEDPIAKGTCLMIDANHSLGSITRGYSYYSSFFLMEILFGA